MTIDPSAETPIPLAAAAKFVPAARNGKRCHLSTVLRWILHGAKATDGTIVKLEAVRLGGRWLTSREALQRFAERLTPHVGEPSPVLPRSERERARASERAAAELDEMGI